MAIRVVSNPSCANHHPCGGGGLSGGALRARVRILGENAGGAKEGMPEIYFGDPDGIIYAALGSTVLR